MDGAKLLEELQDMDTETLIQEVRDNYSLTSELEGLYILQIMQREGYTRHKEVADVIGVSRSYVSLRIKAAKEKYGNIALSRPVGRPKHLVMELDEIHGDNVPLRLVSKVGDIPNSELTRMLMTHIVALSEDNRENFFKEIINYAIDTGKFTNEEIVGYLNEVIKELKQ
jgi:hypothetical protein